MAPYGLYQLNPLTGPLFAWFDQIVSKLTETDGQGKAPEESGKMPDPKGR